MQRIARRDRAEGRDAGFRGLRPEQSAAVGAVPVLATHSSSGQALRNDERGIRGVGLRWRWCTRAVSRRRGQSDAIRQSDGALWLLGLVSDRGLFVLFVSKPVLTRSPGRRFCAARRLALPCSAFEGLSSFRHGTHSAWGGTENWRAVREADDQLRRYREHLRPATALRIRRNVCVTRHVPDVENCAQALSPVRSSLTRRPPGISPAGENDDHRNAGECAP